MNLQVLDSGLVDFPCPLCGKPAQRTLYPDTLAGETPRFGYQFSVEHTRTYRVVVCDHCEHAFCSPRPADLWKNYRDVEDVAYFAHESQRIETSKKVLKRILSFSSRGRLLDVGCATGDFLSVAQSSFQVEGLELSGWAAGIAEQRGFRIHRSTLEAFQPEEKFDVITLWGVIEHFEYPSNEIRHMAGLLKPKGLICLWTGDKSALPAKVLGRKWWYFQGQHIQFFSRRSLGKAFAQEGFEEVSVSSYPYVMTMSSIVQSLQRYPLVGKLSRFLLKIPGLASCRLTLSLPGEMFAIFRKIR